MKQKNLKPKVFFNASVILAGIASPNGGSAKLLTFVKQKRIRGLISEIVLDEILRHANKIHRERAVLEKLVFNIFRDIATAPTEAHVKMQTKFVTDEGDAHVLASYHETNSDFLVTLDKKHLLILQHKIKGVNIVSPKELIEYLSK